MDNAKARRAAASVNEDPEQPLGGAVKTGKSNVPGSYGDFAQNAANLSAEEKKSGIGVDSVAARKAEKARQRAKAKTYAENLVSYGRGKRPTKQHSRVGSRPLNGFSGLYGTGLHELAYNMYKAISLATPIPMPQLRATKEQLKALDDKKNTRFSHDQIFHGDGTNIGFGKKGMMDEETIGDYDLTDTYYDMDIMKEAAKAMRGKKEEYNEANNNCQDYIDKVKDAYSLIETAKRYSKR